MGDGRNKYCSSTNLKRKKEKIYIENIQHPKNLLINRGFSVLLFNRLAHLKWTGLILDRLDLIVMKSSHFVALKVKGSIIHKQLIGIFRVNGTGWGLGLGVNRDFEQIQVREGDLDLTEADVEAISKGTTQLI